MLLAAALLAACSLACSDASGAKRPSIAGAPSTVGRAPAPTSTASAGTEPVQVRIVAPEANSSWGFEGRAFLVDLAITARRDASLRINPRAVASSAQLRAGHSETVPGLVVLLSTTATGAGPQQNLAGLFQVASVGQLSDGTMEIRTAWLAGDARYGADVDTLLTAYLIDGVAPDVVPQDPGRLAPLSNRATVRFHINGGPAPTALGTATTVPTAGARPSEPAAQPSPELPLTQPPRSGAPVTPAPASPPPPQPRPTANPTRAPPASVAPRPPAPPTIQPTVIVTIPPRPGAPPTEPTVIVTIPPRPGGPPNSSPQATP